MNGKQKVLTVVVALIAFVVVGACHYVTLRQFLWSGYYYWYPARVDSWRSLIPDVRMPWFMLGLICVGLFFLLADRKEKR